MTEKDKQKYIKAINDFLGDYSGSAKNEEWGYVVDFELSCLSQYANDTYPGLSPRKLHDQVNDLKLRARIILGYRDRVIEFQILGKGFLEDHTCRIVARRSLRIVTIESFFEDVALRLKTDIFPRTRFLISFEALGMPTPLTTEMKLFENLGTLTLKVTDEYCYEVRHDRNFITFSPLEGDPNLFKPQFDEFLGSTWKFYLERKLLKNE